MNVFTEEFIVKSFAVVDRIVGDAITALEGDVPAWMHEDRKLAQEFGEGLVKAIQSSQDDCMVFEPDTDWDLQEFLTFCLKLSSGLPSISVEERRQLVQLGMLIEVCHQQGLH